jgi:nucleoid DNA-binding protein
MEELSVILLELLQHHYRVSLPGIGSFLVTDQPASFDEQRNVMLPPSKKIIFSKKETWNDGLLEATYAARFGLSEHEAQERVRHLMMDIRFDLDDKGKVNFPNLGCLRQGKHNSIDLEQKNNLSEALGLTTVSLGTSNRPDDEEQLDDIIIDRQKKDKTFLESLSTFRLKPQNIALAILAGFVSIIVASVAFLVLSRGSNQNEQELLQVEKPSGTDTYSLPDNVLDVDENYEYEQPYDKPVATKPETSTPKPSATKKTAAPSVPVVPKPKPTPTPAPKQSADNTQYCIIIASITSLDAAERKVSTLSSAGYRDCHIAEQKNGRYRIAIGCYSDRKQAVRELAKTKDSVPDAWILEK